MQTERRCHSVANQFSLPHETQRGFLFPCESCLGQERRAVRPITLHGCAVKKTSWIISHTQIETIKMSVVMCEAWAPMMMVFVKITDKRGVFFSRKKQSDSTYLKFDKS